MFRSKTESKFNLGEALDKLLASAEKSGASKRSIGELLQDRAQDYALRDAVSVNLGGNPTAKYYDGRGRPL
jgi:hypothetical protein